MARAGHTDRRARRCERSLRSSHCFTGPRVHLAKHRSCVLYIANVSVHKTQINEPVLVLIGDSYTAIRRIDVQNCKGCGHEAHSTLVYTMTSPLQQGKSGIHPRYSKSSKLERPRCRSKPCSAVQLQGFVWVLFRQSSAGSLRRYERRAHNSR